jgi:hypothetical protein
MHFMNKARGRHLMGGEQRPENEHGQQPSIFIHSHAGGHTVHLFHADGTHEVGNDEHVHDALGHHEHDGEPGMGEPAHEITD